MSEEKALPPLPDHHALDRMVDDMVADAAPIMDEWLSDIRAVMQAAGSLSELREMLNPATLQLDTARLAAVINQGMATAYDMGLNDKATSDG